MAIIYATGFNHYASIADLFSDGWSYNNASSYLAFSSTQARTGAYSLRLDRDVHYDIITFRTPSTHLTMGFEFAIYLPELPTFNNACLFQVQTAVGGAVLLIYIQSDGSAFLQLFPHYYQVTIPSVFKIGWNEIQIHTVVNTSTGFCKFKINNVEFTSPNVNTGSTPIGRFVIQDQIDTAAGSYWYIADFVVYNGDVADADNPCNDFLGCYGVQTKFPTADTATADWAKTGATDGYDCINEVVMDSDSTYISSTAVNDTSVFEFENVAAEYGDILAVIPTAAARKTDSGTAGLTQYIVQGGSELGGTQASVAQTYSRSQAPIHVDPVSGIKFTNANVNSAQVKVKRTA